MGEQTGHKIDLAVPQRGEKRSLVDLAGQNAKQSFDQRFRVMQPSQKAIQESLQDILVLPELPKRIECFDISHIQGAETVASLVVWENGAMKKSDYRKFQIKTVEGVDDFASMREVVGRRYKRVAEENKTMPSLILIDGSLGRCMLCGGSGGRASPSPRFDCQAKKSSIYGQEDDDRADRRSPVCI